MEKFELTIDGKKVEAVAGDTVLEAARRAGIFIPSLCALEGLSPYGACRLCVVEIDGVRGTPTSCTTPATPGMVVRTTSELLETNRRRTLELMMSTHPSPCFSCDSRADCESVKKEPTRSGAATRCGTCSNRPVCEVRSVASFTKDIDLPIFYDPEKIEKNDPFIDRDHNVCVLCGRCFRVCEKVHGKPAIGIINRGKFAKISAEFDNPWSGEECLFCGDCVDVCPTGSLTDRWSKWFGKEDFSKKSVCLLCGKHCEISLKIKGGRIISASSPAKERGKSLCALGRFAYSQIVNSPHRLRKAFVRRSGEQIPVSFSEAAEAAAKAISESERILIVSNNACDLNSRACLEELANKFGADFVELHRNADSLGKLPQKNLDSYDCVLEIGNFVSPEDASKIKRLIAIDYLAAPAQKYAEVVVPMAFMGEFAGDYYSSEGEKISVEAAVKPVKAAVPLGEFLGELCRKLEVSASTLPKPEKFEGVSPAEDKSKLWNFDFGHNLADMVPDLALLGLKHSESYESSKKAGEGFEILDSKMVAPNFHEITIKAPDAAKYAKPGQFAVLMANPESERSPFTISDWNREEGWVKFIVEEVGRSSAELGSLEKGDFVSVMSGPLGTPFEADEYGKDSKVLLLGGCYGIAAIYPIARALKNRGANVVCAIEASSSYMLYYKEKLAGVCDRLVVRTRDGTEGKKGGCFDVLKEIGKDFDTVIAIGCVFMMKQCSSAMPEEVKKALCSLNPIMVDGTGMCGACRVSVGGKTKFACVDGPMFPLLEVDFNELISRRNAYKLIEIDAMPRHADSKCYKNSARE